MSPQIPRVSIEPLQNGCIRLASDSGGQTGTVEIHPVHVRYLAEQYGTKGKRFAVDGSEFRTLTELRRRLLVLKDRVELLASRLCLRGDEEHADLAYEKDYATATAEICEAFCFDFDDFRGEQSQGSCPVRFPDACIGDLDALEDADRRVSWSG